jgi:hypothetical protein
LGSDCYYRDSRADLEFGARMSWQLTGDRNNFVIASCNPCEAIPDPEIASHNKRFAMTA